MAMDHSVCPGSKKMRSPTPESLRCRSCGYEVEIWSDELRVTCPQCGNGVMREGLSSCLEWCKSGKQCVGDIVYNDFWENRSASIRQQLFAELESAGTHREQIDKAVAVLNFAEEINKKENGEWNIVVPAAILHNLRETVEERTAIARKILLKTGMRMEDIEVICNVISHFRAPACGEAASLNCRIIHDAVLLAERSEHRDSAEAEIYLTPSGAELSKKPLLQVDGTLLKDII